MLLNAGATKQAIADAADTSTNEIWAILSGKYPAIRQATRDKILAIGVLPPAVADAIGTVRRLRALIAGGHFVADIAAATSLHPSTVHRIASGAVETVSIRTAAVVTAAYESMVRTEGASVRNRLRGQRERWAPPEHWDSIDIDDPEAFPDWTGHCGTARGYHLHHSLRLGFLCDPCRAARSADRAERKAASASPGEPT